MPFILFAAADLYGSKINLELEFQALPTISELLSTIQSTFSFEAVVLRPPHLPLQQFGVSKLQVYNDADGSWRDVISSSQLFEYGQIYVFQADSTHIESQQQILPARRPSRPSTTPTPSSPSQYPPRDSSYTSPNRSIPSLSTYTPPTVTPQTSIPLGEHVRLVGENASLQDKIRYVFDEMDANANRVVEAEEFRQLLRALNIDFSTQTVADLFRKGDSDRDGVLSYAEFTAFFGSYTTMLDALFYRLRDVAEGRLRQQELAQEKANLDIAKEKRARAAALIADTIRQLEQEQLKLNHLDADRQQKLNREKEIRNLVSQAEREADAALRERADSERLYADTRDRDGQRKQQLQDAQRAVADTQDRTANQLQQLSAAQEKERQIHQMLLDAQRETERQQKLLYSVQEALAQSVEREKFQAVQVAESQRELQRMADRLAQAERDALLKAERGKDLNLVLGDNQRELAHLLHVMDDQQREIAACRDRERANRQMAAEADSVVQLQERKLIQKDQEIVQFTQRRAAMEAQEKPLLEQEVRLREQRESLEEKEVRLKREAVSLYDPRGGISGTSALRSHSPPRRL